MSDTVIRDEAEAYDMLTWFQGNTRFLDKTGETMNTRLRAGRILSMAQYRLNELSTVPQKKLTRSERKQLTRLVGLVDSGILKKATPLVAIAPNNTYSRTSMTPDEPEQTARMIRATRRRAKR